MRISDWSSDVCSSDLHEPRLRGRARQPAGERARNARLAIRRLERRAGTHRPAGVQRAISPRGQPGPASQRSEEPTSELQSLMRNSYALLYCKKKNLTTHRTTNIEVS